MDGPATRADNTGPADTAAAEGDATALLMRFARQMRTPLIIEPSSPPMSPGSVARHLVTLACWSLWVHFLMPLLTLLAWMTGWRRLSTQLLAPEGLELLMRYLPAYLAVLGVMCGSLIAWALFNWWRFADRERRRASAGVTCEQVAEALGLPAGELRRWQQARRLVVRHDAQGRPCGADEADCQ
jgi:poly-beta-1,6-N-acetyl-D-glucosamine biosynthesis protein PgaD